MNKVVASADQAVQDVFDGATVMVGGFGLCGVPENLLRALVRKGVKNLHTISNNVGVDGYAMGWLLANGQIQSHIGSYVGENRLLEQMVLERRLDLELVPQGTFSERIRAGGAGIPAFYTPVGFGTELAKGKEVRRFQERDYVLEHAMRGDLALVRADTADRYGNLSFRYAQMNFGPVMATAANLTVAEVRTVLDEPMPHERVQLPGVYVDRVVTVTP